MQRLFGFITGHPWVVILLAVLFTGFCLSQIYDVREGRPLLGFDPSTNRLLPEDDPGREFYEHVRLVFGSDETMLVALHADDLFTKENLQTLKRLTDRLELVDGVHHVTSLANAQNVRGDEFGLQVEPLFRDVPDDPQEIEKLRRQALDNPIFAGNLISKDARTAAILVYFLDFSDAAFFERGIDAEISRIAREEAGESAEVWVTGTPHIKVANQKTQMRELRRNFPIILLVLGVVLAFSFRSARGVAMPLLTVLVALIWTLGIQGLSGRPLNQVTVLVPFLILIIGLSYSVHVVSEFFDEIREGPELDAPTLMRNSLNKVWLPVVLTGATTAVGFLAVLLTPIGAIREFGIFALTGVIGSVVASLTVAPALLVVMGKPRRLSKAAQPGQTDVFSRFAGWMGDLVLKRRRTVFVVAGLVFIGSVISATQLQVSSDSIKSLAPDMPARTDFEAVNEHLDGATTFNVVIDATYVDAFKDPENLVQIEKLQKWLQSQPDVGGTSSLVDYLKLMNRAFHADDPDAFTIPENRRMVGQLLFFGAGDDLERFIDSRYQLANLVVRTPLVDSADLRVLSSRIEERLEQLPPHMKAQVTGNPIVIQRMIDDLIRGQVMTVGGALVVIYVILSLLFVSASSGFIALIPNVLPVAAYFGALGLTGVPLSITTSVVAPMALGIAIDDTIHYFARFSEDAKRLADERRATRHALRTVGRPVTYTSISVCLGFLVLTQSDLLNQVHIGAMGAFTLAFAWLVDFTLTPALCSGLRVVTLWDTLLLDLGDNPQQTIPLFRDLSNPQCRILAQMASMRTVPAGQPLLRSGDEGQEMYVIIDGKLEISVDRDGGRIVLAQSGRGDLVGEVGFFLRRRTANVEVIEDTRLLRLTQDNLKRIEKRRPRLAARVFNNMNAILAGRVQNTTEHLR